MKAYDVVLASGAEHLRSRFEEKGYRVYCCAENYDEKRVFPNGDLYVRIAGIEDLSDRRVVVVQTCTGTIHDGTFFSTADSVVELLLMLDALKRPVEVERIRSKEYKTTPIPPPSHVEVVLTFQPFGLQDKAFETGEAVSARWATETIARNCNKIWAVNPHATTNLEWVQNFMGRDLLDYIDITPRLIDFGAKKFGFEEFEVVTPDLGGQQRFSVKGFSKERSDSFHVQLTGDLDVKGKNVIVLDDLTKSGSTLLNAQERLREQGVADVGLAVVHVLPLVGRGEELLENLFEKCDGSIVTTNTVRTSLFCEKHPDRTYNIVDSLVEIL
ncbi:MAG: phosphoribosyltransferase family protein [Promethearchaeia archaeon]